jgi:hypothetical protein
MSGKGPASKDKKLSKSAPDIVVLGDQTQGSALNLTYGQTNLVNIPSAANIKNVPKQKAKTPKIVKLEQPKFTPASTVKREKLVAPYL